jgi:hypothetical protein
MCHKLRRNSRTTTYSLEKFIDKSSNFNSLNLGVSDEHNGRHTLLGLVGAIMRGLLIGQHFAEKVSLQRHDNG